MENKDQVVQSDNKAVEVTTNVAPITEKMKTATFWVGIFSMVKLGTDAFGINLPNVQWDAVANALAVLGTTIGVIASHIKAGNK